MSKLQRLKRNKNFDKTKYPLFSREREINQIKKSLRISDRIQFYNDHPYFGQEKPVGYKSTNVKW